MEELLEKCESTLSSPRHSLSSYEDASITPTKESVSLFDLSRDTLITVFALFLKDMDIARLDTATTSKAMRPQLLEIFSSGEMIVTDSVYDYNSAHASFSVDVAEQNELMSSTHLNWFNKKGIRLRCLKVSENFCVQMHFIRLTSKPPSLRKKAHWSHRV